MFAANGEVRVPTSHVCNPIQSFDVFHQRIFVRLEIVSTPIGTNLFNLSRALLFLLFLFKVSLREPWVANLSSRTIVSESILMLLML